LRSLACVLAALAAGRLSAGPVRGLLRTAVAEQPLAEPHNAGFQVETVEAEPDLQVTTINGLVYDSGMNNLIISLGQDPLKMRLLAALAALLLVVAAVLFRRRKSFAVVTGVLGALAATLLVVVVIRHPHAFAGDSANLEQLATVELTTSAPTGDDWPQWRGPNRDGVGLAKNLRADWTAQPPDVLWKVPLGGGYSSFAIVGDSAWTQDFRDGKERVVCLDVTTGKERWSHDYSVDYSGFKLGYAQGPRATPTVHGGRVYTVGSTGTMHCLDALPADGTAKVHWRYDLLTEYDAEIPKWGVACSPLVEGDLVIVQPGGSRGSIVAFDRETGTQRWTTLGDASGYSSPMAATLAGTRQIIALTGSRLVGLNPTDGALLWEYDFPTQHHGNIATPVIAGDTVFVSASYGTGCALVKINRAGENLVVEQLFRQKKLLRTHHMTAVLLDGHLYACDENRDLKCVNLRTAQEMWDTPRPGKGNIILVDKHLIHLSQEGTLSLIEATPAGFRPKGKMEGLLSASECWALPALSAGRLLVRDGTQAMCLRVAD